MDGNKDAGHNQRPHRPAKSHGRGGQEDCGDSRAVHGGCLGGWGGLADFPLDAGCAEESQTSAQDGCGLIWTVGD